jgi:hypothetical protein
VKSLLGEYFQQEVLAGFQQDVLAGSQLGGVIMHALRRRSTRCRPCFAANIQLGDVTLDA